MAEETEADPTRQQGDAAALTRGCADEEAEESDKEVTTVNYFVLSVLLLAFATFGQDTRQDDMKDCLMHGQHSAQSHQAVVNGRGDQAMGFPHDKTTHHFRLYKDGGGIEVVVNDDNDSHNLLAIRSHLAHIAVMFSNGDFAVPMFVHDQVPPGVPVMKKKHAEISYAFRNLPTGGEVRLKATNPDALQAIHDFLRFQIADHHTGDRTDASPER